MAQECTRPRGSEVCMFHSKHKVTLVCTTCYNVLVCYECVTSSEHLGHSFNKLETVVMDKVKDIYTSIQSIETDTIPTVTNERTRAIQDILALKDSGNQSKSQLNSQQVEIKQKLDEISVKMNNSIDSNIRIETDKLNVHVNALDTIEDDLKSKMVDFKSLLRSGTDVAIFDSTEQDLPLLSNTSIPNKPNIQMQEFYPCHDPYPYLIRATGTVQQNQPAPTSPTLISTTTTLQDISLRPGSRNTSRMSKQVKANGTKPKYQFSNVNPRLYSICPISEDSAIAGQQEDDLVTNKVRVISKK